MKLIIEITEWRNTGLVAFKKLDFSSIAENNQINVLNFTRNKAKIESYLRLAYHIEQIVQNWDYTNGDSLPSNDTTTGQSESKLSSFSLNSISDTKEPSDERITTEQTP